MLPELCELLELDEELESELELDSELESELLTLLDDDDVLLDELVELDEELDGLHGVSVVISPASMLVMTPSLDPTWSSTFGYVPPSPMRHQLTRLAAAVC